MTSKMLNKRIIWIDNLRAICILYVICIGHLDEYTCLDLSGSIINKFHYGILALFMFVSGYCISKYRFITMKDIHHFYRKRMVRIFPLFVLATCLLYIVSHYLHFSYIQNFNQFLLTIMGLTNFFPPTSSTVWYASMLLVFYAITPLIIGTNSSIRKVIIRGSIFLFYLVILYWIISIDIRLIYYFPIYLIGFIIGSFKKEKFICDKESSLGKVAIFCALALLGCTLSILVDRLAFLNSFVWWGASVLMVLLFEFSLIAAGIQLCYRVPKLFSKLFTVISYCSFCMYLFHRPFYAVIYYWIGSNIPLWLAYIVLLPLLIVISYILQKLYDKFIDKVIYRKENNSKNRYD